MIKAIIIDDEQAAGEVINNLIRSYTTEVEVCSICRTIDDAVRDIQRFRPDILFLDIELAEGSGFEILEKSPGLQTRIVFVTAYEQYALKAIKHHAFDYILKPLVPDEFREVLNKVIRDIKISYPFSDSSALLNFVNNHISPQRIAVPIRNGLHYYDLQDIIMLEGQGSYTKMYLVSDKEILITRILKDFETSLTGTNLLRVHKSFLVNTRHIVEFRKEDSGYLVMSNGKIVPVSLKEREIILAKLQAFVNII